MATYIAFLSIFMVYSSILNYLSGLSHYLKSRGSQGVDFSNHFIRSALNGAREICGKGRGKSPGIFPKDMLLMFSMLNMCNVNDMVFWCALTLAFRCLLRISNYCKLRHALRVSGVVSVKDGIIIKIRSSKTNQFREYVSEILLYTNTDSLLCPVSWLKDMLVLRDPARDEMIFKISNDGKWIPMTGSWFNNKLKSISAIPGVSSHGLRRGGATYMLCNKSKLAEVRQRGLWKSDCVYEYLSLPLDQSMRRDRILV